MLRSLKELTTDSMSTMKDFSTENARLSYAQEAEDLTETISNAHYSIHKLIAHSSKVHSELEALDKGAWTFKVLPRGY